MKIAKASVLLKKAAAMCKSKTGLLAAKLLILASLQGRRMAAVAVISHKIHALAAAEQERANSKRALVMRKVEKRQAVVHGGDMAAILSHQLELLDQEHGNGCCTDWTLHPVISDGDNCYHTNEYDDNDAGDVLLDVCHAGDDDKQSVMDVIRRNRKIEGLEFNMEDEIDQATDMFIRRFRQQLNNSF